VIRDWNPLELAWNFVIWIWKKTFGTCDCFNLKKRNRLQRLWRRSETRYTRGTSSARENETITRIAFSSRKQSLRHAAAGESRMECEGHKICNFPASSIRPVPPEYTWRIMGDVFSKGLLIPVPARTGSQGGLVGGDHDGWDRGICCPPRRD